MQQCMYETNIHNIDDLRKRLMQTWFDFKQDVYRRYNWPVRSCVRDGGGHFEHMLWSEWLFIWFIRTICEIVSVIWSI